MELKPCPFCGRKDARIAHKTVDRTDCMGKLGTRFERFRIYCASCAGQTSWGFYVEDVAEAWNRRANDV